MMRSMYSGVSGLKNHQARMDIIGNNIANVNTNGYKKSRVVFKDTFYQTIRSSSSPTGSRGGTNPMGVGLGMTLGSIDQIHTPSPTTVTNKMTDMAVDGDGYFIIGDGSQMFFTRSGNFDFDRQGNLVSNANGMRVQGWVASKDELDSQGNWKIDTIKAVQAIGFSLLKDVSPQATANMFFEGNLDSLTPVSNAVNAADQIYTTKEYYDSLGNKKPLYFRFEKLALLDEVEINDGGGSQQVNGTLWRARVSEESELPNPTTADNKSSDFYLFFDSQGQLIRTKANQGTPGVISDDWVAPDTNDIIPFKESDGTSQSITINHVEQGVKSPQDISFDFAQLTQFNSKSTAWVKEQDGYRKGTLSSFSIGTDGIITGIYDNGETRNLARVALAHFDNPAGLSQTGNNLFQVSNNSGDAKIGAPGEAGVGTIIPGSLEMSNVDLSEEFTDLITTQRGFQANSRLITTSDEMLQELVNLKR